MTRLATSALALVILIAACSGEDDGRLSREEYIRQADAICLDYDKRLSELSRPASIEELGRVAGEAHSIAGEGVAKLHALRPPEELDGPVRDWLERNDENVQKIEEIGEAARAGNETQVQEIAADAAENEKEADRIARRIGLKACAKAD